MDDEAILEEMRKAQPAWKADGLGLRGGNPELISNTRGNLFWDSVPVFRRANPEAESSTGGGEEEEEEE